MRRSPLAVALLSLAFAAPAFAEKDSYSIFSTHKKVGFLVATRDGDRVMVEYQVSENGRGPGSQEKIVFGADGLPLSWEIEGHGLGGGKGTESFRYENGTATWSSAAEKGTYAGEPKLFVPATASPWAAALYARLALSRPDGRLAVLPSGSLTATRRESLEIGSGAAATTVDVVVVAGLDMTPDYLLVDRQGKLFADLGTMVIVRDGYEAEVPRLLALNARLMDELQAEMHARLAHRLMVPWHLTNVRVFDAATRSLGPPSTVTVFDDRIVSVAPGVIAAAPAGEKLIDGGGGALLPGLVDMHAHEEDLLAYQHLAAGVTTVRDMGNDNERLLEVRYQQRVHRLDGPRIVPAGFVEGKSPYSASAGITVDSQEAALAALHWYARRGYRYLKTYNSMNPEWIPALVAEAHRLGLKVLGHVPAFTTADRQIAAGYDEITHLNQLMLQYVLQPEEDPRTTLRLTAMHRFAGIDLGGPAVRRTIALMQEHHTALDTTIAAMERLNIQRDGVTPEGDHLHLDHMPLMFQRTRRRVFLDIPDPKTDREHFAARDQLIFMVGLLHREGIRLWPGTDDAVAFPIHRELELYVKAGIAPAEVLQIATRDAIVELGLGHDLGTIEAGKLADFILVPGDPTQDITAVRNVSLVAQDGTIFFPAEIYQALNVLPFSAAPVLE